jgi:glycine/D-amino acid oxidase-like deaminating enzyme
LGEAPDWGLTPVERLEATSRKVQGNRLMLRTGFSYKHELESAKAREALAHALSDRYPGMNPDCFEHVWGGAVSLTRNEAPILRRVGRQAYAVSGCNASGILKMTALGELLADLATGRASALLEETLAMCKPAFIPPDPIRRIAVNINLCRFKRELKGNRDEHRPIHA